MKFWSLAVVVSLAAIAQTAAALPTIYVVGDSTASNTERKGWGDPFSDYFDLTKVNVVNRARAGRSSRTFLTEGLWDRVAAELKPGDFVLIQFGHNDGGGARASLPGTGEETLETVHTFGWYLRKYIADTRAKGATPILLSLTVRNIWTGGKVERGSGHFGEWTAEVARSENAAFADVTQIIADRYEKMGPEKVKELFPVDHTHTSAAGADLNAACVMAALRTMPNFPFLRYLSAKGREVLPTLYLIGDSTVRNGRGDGSNGQWGWGEPLVDRFDTTRIHVVNRAVGGLSSRTYLTGGHWDKVIAMLQPGDFVMMQFGHNDSGPLDDTSRARGTLPGSGEETRDIDNPITGQHETVHTYGWYLRKFIADTRAKGATPMVCSLVPRKIWKEGKIARANGSYAAWAAEVATSENALFLDLNEIIALRYDELGPEKVEPLFADEHTHTSRAGAELNADSVVAALKSLQDNPLVKFLAEDK